MNPVPIEVKAETNVHDAGPAGNFQNRQLAMLAPLLVLQGALHSAAEC